MLRVEEGGVVGVLEVLVHVLGVLLEAPLEPIPGPLQGVLDLRVMNRQNKQARHVLQMHSAVSGVKTKKTKLIRCKDELHRCSDGNFNFFMKRLRSKKVDFGAGYSSIVEPVSRVRYEYRCKIRYTPRGVSKMSLS